MVGTDLAETNPAPSAGAEPQVTPMTVSRLLLLLPVLTLAAACTEDEPGKQTGDVGEPGTTEPDDTGDTDEPDEDPVPASLVVSVDSYVGDVGQTFEVSVQVLDADGAEIPGVDTDLLVDDPLTADLLGPQVTFLTEGIFTVTATLGDGSMPTQSDPIRIDDNGPQITLTSPTPGLWLEGSIAVVAGTVVDALAGVDTVLVAGEAVELGSDGSFSVEVPVDPGATALEVVATDIDGNAADAFVGVMSGASIDPTAAMDGMRVAIGADGIASIAEPLLSELDPAVVESQLESANPVARGSVGCVTYRADVTSVDYGAPTLTVTPLEDLVRMDVELTDLEILIDVDLDLCGFSSMSDVITVTDTLTTITADIEITHLTSFGITAVGISESSVTYADLDVDYGALGAALATFGYTPTDLGIDPGEIIEEAILEVVDAEVPPPIQAAVDAMEISETLDVLSVPITLDAAISDVELTVDGVELILETITTGPAAAPTLPELPGTLSLGGDPPAVDPGVELGLALFLDELNRILYNAHASGAFRIEMSDAELGLEPALIDFVFPGATTLDLRFEPSLPPVLLPSDSGDNLDLAMLSLALEARGLVDGVDTELVTGHVHVLGSVEAGINADGDIALEVTDVTPIVDTSTPTDPSGVAAAEALEESLATISIGIIGDLFPTIVFAIPEVEGMSIVGTDASTAGSAETWLKVNADITE